MFTLIAEIGDAIPDTCQTYASRGEVVPGQNTGSGTKGAGSGRDLAITMAAAIAEAITHGLLQIRHLEEIAILREGIGADRMSDATGESLRRRLG